MNKLFKLKQWLSLQEAADHLTTMLGEEVTLADIYRLALSKHLRLSINLVNHGQANIGRLVHKDEARFHIYAEDFFTPETKEVRSLFPSTGTREEQLAWFDSNRDRLEQGKFFLSYGGDFIDQDNLIEYENKLTTIKGIWDLPMHGGERLDILHALQAEIGGPPVTLTCLDGTLLVDPNDPTRYAQVLEHYSNNEYCKDGNDRKKYPYGEFNSYYPAGGLPDDAVIVVRTGAIVEFLEGLQDEPSQSARKELRSDARRTYARIIAALWRKAHGDGGVGRLPLDPYTVGAALADMLSRADMASPDAATIGKRLAEEVLPELEKIRSSEKPA